MTVVLPDLERQVARVGAIDRMGFETQIKPAGQPVILKHITDDWPALAAARAGNAALVAYLKRFATSDPVPFMAGAPDGRFFFDAALEGFNHRRDHALLSDVLDWLLARAEQDDAERIYLGGLPVDKRLPGFAAQNAMPLVEPALIGMNSIWIGNRTRTAAHWDLQQNLACPLAGRRRFILFPPDAIGDLYIGPFDRTLAGQPTSLVDFAAPDHARFPRFVDALARAQVADLEPGDTLYIPALWFHHVETLSGLGVMINFWWREGLSRALSPVLALYLALIAVRDLPHHERAAWRAFFDHYIFDSDGSEMAHVPEAARGLMGPASEDKVRELQRYIARRLGEV